MVLIKTATVSQSIRKYIYKIQISFFFSPGERNLKLRAAQNLTRTIPNIR